MARWTPGRAAYPDQTRAVIALESPSQELTGATDADRNDPDASLLSIVWIDFPSSIRRWDITKRSRTRRGPFSTVDHAGIARPTYTYQRR